MSDCCTGVWPVVLDGIGCGVTVLPPSSGIGVTISELGTVLETGVGICLAVC